MWFQAIIYLILGCFFGWLLPEPFNYLSAVAGVFAFFCCITGEDDPVERHPYYQPTKAPTEKPYTEFKRVERIAKEELVNILYHETKSGLKECMRCGAYVMVGFILPRREAACTDTYFFCFSCKKQIVDTDLLVKIARERMKDALEGKFDLHLDERDVMILDTILHHFDLTKFKELDVKQYADRFFVIESDVVETKRKISLFAEALRSSHQKPATETVDEENTYWMGL